MSKDPLKGTGKKPKGSLWQMPKQLLLRLKELINRLLGRSKSSPSSNNEPKFKEKTDKPKSRGRPKKISEPKIKRKRGRPKKND